MIIRLINEDNIWIPSFKLFSSIMNRVGLEYYSEEDKEIAEKKINEEYNKEHDVWFFNIKFNFNIKDKDSDDPLNCIVRIIKNRINDGCSGCIMLVPDRPQGPDEMNFDFKFSKYDL